MRKHKHTYSRIGGGYERCERCGNIRATMKYGSFGKIHDKEAIA